MDYAEIKRQSLRVFIGFLILTALIAIVSVLSGSFGEVQLKILATSATISAASICSMSCAAFIEKKKMPELGLSGIFLSILGAVLLIAGMWPEIDSKGYWKTTITCIVFAIAFAHAFLLVLPQLEDKHRFVQRASSASIGLLAFLIVLAVWAEIDTEDYFRLLAVVAIVVGLETLVVPILMKLRKGNSEEAKVLRLESIGGETYKDADGNTYTVKQINSE